MGPVEALRDLLGPPLADAGLELWDVEVSGPVVRVLVDRPGGVDLDALTAASAVVSPLLDEHDELTPPERYELEVSSPGVERTLRTPEHHRRHLGQVVSVKTAAPVAGARRWQGTLVAADAEAITVAPDGGAEPVRIPLDLVARTRTVLVWGPAPKPGRRPTTVPSQPAKERDT